MTTPRRTWRTPLDVAKAYSAGTIDRAQLMEILSNWHYRTYTDGPEWDDIRPVSDLSSLMAARLRGYIDDSIFEAVCDALAHPER